ncbi:MAG: DUF4367 domain-containing protein [Methanoregula sp.]|jgi:outer membrane lipoprotein-sorting protein|nr:DUF4367 domain-containing protein [Methanoregula sp.]
MNGLFWLIAAALAILIIGGCIQAGLPDAGTGRIATPSVSLTEKYGSVPLHEMPAGEIAAAFIRHNNNLSGYSATMHVVGGNGYDDNEYHFFAHRPDRFRAEYIRSEIHGNGTLVVANGTFVWQYHPDAGTASPSFIEDPDNTFFARKDYTAIAARILEKNHATLNSTEQPGGSNAVILEAAVEDTPTQYFPELFSRIRVWIDEETLLMTRMELVGYYNETVLAADLQNISANPRLPDEMFNFGPPSGTEISPGIAELVAPRNLSSMRQAKERFGQNFVVPAYLPSGYSFRYCLHYRDGDGRDSLVYSDGVDDLVFTLALQKDNASFAPGAGQEEAVAISNLTGTFWTESTQNHVRWNEGDGIYELAGPFTKDELVRIAESLAASKLLNFAPGEIKNPETIAELALRDTSARRMVDAGGEIIGVGMSVKRGTRDVPGGVYPALLIRYNGITADFMVDPVTGTAAGRTIQVPNGAMIDHEGDRTFIELNGKILFTFDPMEEST